MELLDLLSDLIFVIRTMAMHVLYKVLDIKPRPKDRNIVGRYMLRAV